MLWVALGAAALAGCGDDDALMTASCTDGLRNGGESGVDCGGGVCGACAEGGGCLQHGDCATGVCGADGTCVAVSCTDGLVNGDETDADCGGSCDGCDVGDSCQAGSDCATGVCDDGRCAGASCGDGVVNGDEACDDGGESASCNADCTAASCGDRVVNYAAGETCDEGGTATATCDADCTLRACGDSVVNDDAGETCDTGGNSATCDLDCTAPVCGDGLPNSAAGEDCDTAGDSLRCDMDCSPAVCGDDYVNAAAGEDCEEGAVDTGTCDFDCSAAACGDGYANTAAGEDCDDGNATSGDGCDDQCAAEFVTLAPRAISGALSCGVDYSSTGRKVAIDGERTIYVAMECGGEAHVAVSRDLGATYSAPRPLGITGVDELAVEASSGGTVYVAAVTSGGLEFTRSTDAGLTWEAPTTLSAEFYEPVLSMDSLGDSVFIAVGIDAGTGLRVLRNHSAGAGAFDSVDLLQGNYSHDLIGDEDSGDVFLTSQNPELRLRRSTDGAASFGSELNPPGFGFDHSDWAGGGYIYMVSSDYNSVEPMYAIPMSDLSTSVAVTGLPNTGFAPVRAIDADALGNAYITSQPGTAIQLDRLLAGAASISSADAREISASGAFPGVAAVPSNNGAVVVFGQGTTVMAAVQVY